MNCHAKEKLSSYLDWSESVQFLSDFKRNWYTQRDQLCQNGFAFLLKRGLLWKERICSPWEQILSFYSGPPFRRGLVYRKANLSIMLTFTPFMAISADDKLMVFSLIFQGNRFWHFMQIVSNCQNLFSERNWENIQNVCWKYYPECLALKMAEHLPGVSSPLKSSILIFYVFWWWWCLVIWFY